MLSGLPPIDLTGRLDRVRHEVDARGCDSIVLSARSSIRWCTGFTGSYGVVVITADAATLITDNRYADRARAELAAAGSATSIVASESLVKEGASLLANHALIGFEAEFITWAEQQDWATALAGEAVPTRLLVAELRSVKDASELARIQCAAGIVDDALADVHDLLRPETAEIEFALALDDAMRARGADGPAFTTIVASGPNSAIPHATPTNRAFLDGDLVIVDVGALVEGYRSDMTRTFAIGDLPPVAIEINSVVARANAAGVAAVGAGVEAAAVDDACRSIITDAGYGEAFVHGTGHGIGLDIHELPAVRRANTAILQPGQVITIEPGIYLPGFGGVRIEDSVVVTETGCHLLTHSPKISF